MATYTSAYTGVEIDKAISNANKMLLAGAADPTTATAGNLGQIYQNTTSGALFRCVNIAGAVYTWDPVYKKSEIDALLAVKDTAIGLKAEKNEVVSNLTNGLTNGDLSQGTAGWSNFTGSTLSAVNNVLSIVGNGGSGTVRALQTTNILCADGKKIYVSLKAKVTNPDCTGIFVRVDGTTSGGNVITFQSAPTINTVYSKGVIITLSSVVGNAKLNIQHSYADAATANAKVMEVQNVLLIDLTSAFGSGNEPTTTAEMDRLLSFFPNSWFDGTAKSNQLIQAMLQVLKLKSDRTQESWIIPTLANTGSGTVKYRKDQFGNLQFIGYITQSSVASSPFTLAAGYKPTEDLKLPVCASDGTVGYVSIATTGVFTIPVALQGKNVILNGLDIAIA